MIEPSAPLVPIDDDSLLWINSGVATLKNTLMVARRQESQNCKLTKAIRTNDIENVGFTARHHTFLKCLEISQLEIILNKKQLNSLGNS